MKLQKFISNFSSISRREAEILIKEGKVKVNDKVILTPYFNVGLDEIVKVNDKIIKPILDKFYIAFNKPPQVVSTLKRGNDNFLKDKKIVLDFLNYDYKNIKNLRIAGRLDFLSEGLLILSNDGDFINLIIHPSYKIEKEYVLISFKEISNEFIIGFLNGVYINNILYKAKNVKKINNYSVKIVLIEGKNREIRNVAKYFSQPIKRLIRTAIDDIKLGDLKYGKTRLISIEDVNKIKLKKLKKDLY
ncbi:MAG: pseudouridine synthase [Spirochaetes bacterium]|nr:pseudouridine synthase [Spirochaetota bacterium]